ncbi:hypothetical protein N39L_45470 [Limnospira platensis NIES-39]|nr:hypothetical protein AP285_20740 [Arthrospira platensis YZ]KDR53930.1 hypothetical protein APPUASWS_030590 [Arthrospira platensis str. Paraca]BAI92553.1 hypothetical protein NIES39_L03960 [Arthrospira platensis NIES-39]BDT14824.1 hypothetical protein N39L_45470 [Arthrospira platensis NIES-39]
MVGFEDILNFIVIISQLYEYVKAGKRRKKTEKDGSLIKKCKNLWWLPLIVENGMFQKRN